MTERAQDVTAETFVSRVMEASRDKVVIVDFWAPWCAPCKTLGPILEQAVAKYGGKVALVKVNVDQEPELAAHFRVQSIPTVWAIMDEKPVANFAGAQPAEAVESWVSRLLPTVEEDTLESARQFIAERRPAEAERILRGLLAKNPADNGALLLLGRLVGSRGKTAEARDLLGKIPEGASEKGDAEQELVLLDMIEAGSGGVSAARSHLESNPTDPDSRFALAGALWAAGDLGGAMDELLELVRKNRSYRKDGARRALLAAFQRLGVAHPEVAGRRSKLAMILFA